MKCPKCGGTEDIKFFVRHQKTDENDESTNANCLTILHANPECGFNESRLLEDCLDSVFPNWSEIIELQNKLNKVEQNLHGMNSLISIFDEMEPNEVIETDGEIVENDELPPIQESEDIESENADKAIESDRIESENND